MKDIVRHFEKISLDKNFIYTYGTMSALNLKMNSQQPDELDGDGNVINKIYMLAEPTTRQYNLSTGGNERLSNVVYTGALMLVMKSNLATPYFAEQDNDPKESKYTMHVEPLLEMIPSIINYFICEELTVTSFTVVDWIDYLDEQRDGIMIRYTLQDEF